MIYLELFWAFFQIGLLSFGGGYAALPMIQEQVVDTRQWMTMAEFTDIITISQITPGPIGINAATFSGTKIAGLSGAIIATLGCVTPSFIIVLALAYIYGKYRNLKIIQGVLAGLRPAVIGLIAASGVSITILAFWSETVQLFDLSAIDLQAVILFAAGLFLLRRFKTDPIVVMLGSGGVGLIIYFLQLV